MASETYPAPPEPDARVVSLSRSFSTAFSLGLTISGEQTDKSREGSCDLEDAFNIGFIDDQMLLDVSRDIGKIPEPKFVMPQSVQVDASNDDSMEEDEVQVLFEDVKRTGCIQNKQATSKAFEINKLTMANQKLTKEVEDLKLQMAQQKSQMAQQKSQMAQQKSQMAQQKSQNLIDRQEHSNQFLGVLNAELTCHICSDIIIEAAAIECGHIFCSYCISTWFSQQTIAQSCPTCRAAIYRDPIKIPKVSMTIASFHSLLSQEVQSSRRQLLEDRKAEEKMAQEAREQWFRSLAQAHERVSEAVRHLRGLSPDVSVFEATSLGQSQTSLSSSIPPSGPNSDHPRIFLPSYIDPALLLNQRLNAAATPNPTRPTTSSQPANNQDGATLNAAATRNPPTRPTTSSQPANNQNETTVVPPQRNLRSRSRRAPQVTVPAGDQVMETSARLTQGPPSVSHQVHTRDPIRLRPRRRPDVS